MSAVSQLSTKRQLVAIIDDDQSVLRALKRLLDTCGIATEVFDSGEAFLERDGVNDVACIVLDINLGGISGIEMRRRLSAMGYTIPVIFITARDTTVIRKEAMDAGCVAYLSKPFSGRELIDAIQKATSFF